MTRRSINHMETDRFESEELPQMPDITTNRQPASGLTRDARRAGSLVLRRGMAPFLPLTPSLLMVAGGAQARSLAPDTGASNGDCGALSVSNPSGNVGSPGDPCLITSDSDLDTMLSMINADTGHNGASTLSYELTANLNYAQDSSNTTSASTANWRGIDWLSGTFNGDGYTISNIKYTSDSSTTPIPGTDAAGSDFGFFRVLNDATVENLTLQNVNVASTTSNAS